MHLGSCWGVLQQVGDRGLFWLVYSTRVPGHWFLLCGISFSTLAASAVFCLSLALSSLFLAYCWWGHAGSHLQGQSLWSAPWCSHDETTCSGRVLVPETPLSMPLLCVVMTTSCSSPCSPCGCCLQFSGSPGLCASLTCFFLLHRVFAHHADFKEAPGCNH